MIFVFFNCDNVTFGWFEEVMMKQMVQQPTFLHTLKNANMEYIWSLWISIKAKSIVVFIYSCSCIL